MPNIRSQRVDDNGLEIVASDGRVFSVTKSQVRAFYLSTSGNAASRRNQTITWLKNGIVAALGADQVDILGLDYDFSTADGRITNATIGRAF